MFQHLIYNIIVYRLVDFKSLAEHVWTKTTYTQLVSLTLQCCLTLKICSLVLRLHPAFQCATLKSWVEPADEDT